MSPKSKPLGLRREVLIFLPTAVLLLMVVAAFDVLTYRNAVQDLYAERLDEARAVAAGAAARLATESSSPTVQSLGMLAPVGGSALVLDEMGRLVTRSNPLPESTADFLIDPLPRSPAAFGPDEGTGTFVVACAPFRRHGRALWVRIDKPDPLLAKQLETLQRSLLLNTVLLGSITLLVLLFLRRVLAPFESLLSRAKELDGSGESGEDDVEFLIDTFERAIDALTAQSSDQPDELAAIERTLAPSLESGLMLLDRQGTVLVLNDFGRELLDLDQQSIGISADAFLEPQSEVRACVLEALENEIVIQRRECTVESAEETRTIGLSVHPLRRDDQSLRGYLVLFTDLTEANVTARQAQVARSLRHLGELAAGVAHEMRNGLATIKGYLTLIEHRPDEGGIDEYLDEMRQETGQLERVLADFLSFARPGSVRAEPIRLDELVARTLADPTLGPTTSDVAVAESELEVQGDSTLLQRALRNLVQNAAEAQAGCAPDEPIRVSIRRDGNELAIDVEDCGPGISEDVRESLFQPFVSGRPDGVGLGLSLAHRIAELHDGRLELVDRPTGGVRASLYLPVAIVT